MRMSYQWWAWHGCFWYHAGSCLSEMVVWSYAFHIQMPLNFDTPTDSLKVEKICNIGQRICIFGYHLSIDLASLIFHVLVWCGGSWLLPAFLENCPQRKPLWGPNSVLHPSNTAAGRNLLTRLTPMTVLVECGAECLVCVVQLTNN